jgi:hypothetical protein
MNARILSFTAAALLTAAPAFAQNAPPPGPANAPNPAMRQAFRQLRTQMESIRRTERTEILAALTPAHRSLLASIAGELTTNASPDYRAAAQRLDAALSANEKQRILQAAQTAREQARSLFESMRSQLPEPTGSRGEGPMRAGPFFSREPRREEDAGRVLLGLMAPMGMGFGERPGRPH